MSIKQTTCGVRIFKEDSVSVKLYVRFARDNSEKFSNLSSNYGSTDLYQDRDLRKTLN